MTTVETDGVTLGVEHFGDAAAPLVLSGKCLKASRKNKHDHKCMLLVSVHNTIRRSGVAGSNKFTFTGKLVAGTFELTVTPAGGTAHTVTFKVSG
jgi:hypothetical protein